MAEHEFRNLEGLYNGDSSGWHEPDDPGGWEGGWREKVLGEPFRAKLYVDYRGPGGRFDIGIGLKYEPGATWAVKSVYLGLEPVWATYEIIVEGTWDTQLTLNRRVDVLKFVQTEGGPRDIGGNGFIIAAWENSTWWGVTPVYYQGSIPNHEVVIPNDPTITYYEGIRLSNSSYFPIGKHNGDSFTVKFPVDYRGPGGQIKVAATPRYDNGPTWAQEIMDVDMSSSYVRYYAEVTGIFNTTHRPFDQIGVLKAVQTVNGQLYESGDNMLDSELDQSVYFHATEEHEFTIVDDENLTYYDGKLRSSFERLGKQNGETFSVRFPFEYRGPGGRFKFGAGLTYTPEWTWAEKVSIVPTTTDWSMYYTDTISGIFNTDLRPGDQISTRKMIVSEYGQFYDSGDTNPKEFPASDEDSDVYYREIESMVHEAQIIDEETRTYYDGIVLSDRPKFPIGHYNGDMWAAKYTFQHKGEAGQVIAGAYLKYPPVNTTVTKTINVTRDLDWKEYTVEVSGIWDTSLGQDDRVDVIKFVNTTDKEELDHNDDVAVYYHKVGPAPTCTSDSDCPENYECKDGKCVYVEPGDDGIMDWLEKYYLYLGAGGLLIAGGVLLTTGKRKKK